MRRAGAIVILFFFPVILFSQKAGSLLHVADSLADMDQYSEALKLALQLASEAPKDPEAYVIQARCYNALYEEAKCLAAIEKAEKLHADRDTRHRLNYLKADSYLHLQDYKQAMKYCEKYVGYFPDDGDGLELHGFLFYLDGQYDKAIPNLEKALSDTGLTTSTKAHALDILGYCYYEQDSIQKAMLYDSLCLALDENYYDAVLLSAKISFAGNDFDQALAIYKTLHKRDSSDFSVLYEISNCYFYLKDYDKALAGYKSYLARFPESSGVNNIIAWTLFMQKKYNLCRKSTTMRCLTQTGPLCRMRPTVPLTTRAAVFFTKRAIMCLRSTTLTAA